MHLAALVRQCARADEAIAASLLRKLGRRITPCTDNADGPRFGLSRQRTRPDQLLRRGRRCVDQLSRRVALSNLGTLVSLRLQNRGSRSLTMPSAYHTMRESSNSVSFIY